MVTMLKKIRDGRYALWYLSELLGLDKAILERQAWGKKEWGSNKVFIRYGRYTYVDMNEFDTWLKKPPEKCVRPSTKQEIKEKYDEWKNKSASTKHELAAPQQKAEILIPIHNESYDPHYTPKQKYPNTEIEIKILKDALEKALKKREAESIQEMMEELKNQILQKHPEEIRKKLLGKLIELATGPYSTAGE